MICSCGKRFSKVYSDTQINKKLFSDATVKFVYAKCPDCGLYEEIIIDEIPKDV